MTKVNRRSARNSRQRILSAALKVFSDKGFLRTTMREIAARANLSVGALYVHFKNKEALYRELIAEQRAAFENQTLPLKKEPPPSALRSYIERNLKYAITRKELVALHLKDNDVSFMGPVRKAFFSSQKRMVEEILKAGVREGSFEIRNCEHMALVILFAIRGAVTSYFAKSVADLDHVCDFLCGLVAAEGTKEVCCR